MQAQNGVNFEFWVRFDLESQGQLTHQNISGLNQCGVHFSANLVILAWTSDMLSHGQAHDYSTHRQTHRQRQKQYPKAKTGLGKNRWEKLHLKGSHAKVTENTHTHCNPTTWYGFGLMLWWTKKKRVICISRHCVRYTALWILIQWRPFIARFIIANIL